MVFFILLGKVTELLCLVCCLLFHSGVAEWSFLGDRELFTPARQHIQTRLVFSSDCTEASTLSQSPHSLA